MQSSYNALIIDDDIQSRGCCKDVLTKLGIYSVGAGGHGGTILQIIKDSLLAIHDTKLNVLLVDDSITSRKCAKRILEMRLGHRVVEANDGAKAVKLVQNSIRNNEPFDMVLIDCVMPVLDGPSTAKELKSMGFTGLIVGFTGVSQLDHSKFIAAGACMVLEKPLQPQSIFQLLKGV